MFRFDSHCNRYYYDLFLYDSGEYGIFIVKGNERIPFGSVGTKSEVIKSLKLEVKRLAAIDNSSDPGCGDGNLYMAL